MYLRSRNKTEVKWGASRFGCDIRDIGVKVRTRADLDAAAEIKSLTLSGIEP